MEGLYRLHDADDRMGRKKRFYTSVPISLHKSEALRPHMPVALGQEHGSRKNGMIEAFDSRVYANNLVKQS